MRVLFSSTSGYGHVFPMVPLARAFAVQGHQVLWATGGDSCGLVTAAGLEVVAAGLFGQRLQELRQRVYAGAVGVPPEQMAGHIYPRLFGAGLTPPMVADLLPLAHRWRPDLLVHENGELAAPLVGAVLGVPTVTHAFGGAVPAAFLAEAGNRLGALWAEHGQSIPAHAGCFMSTYLDICPAKVQSVSLGHIGESLQLRPVPYGGERAANLPACLTDDDSPLVYLTLGTVQRDAAVLSAATEGLADMGVRILVTVGADGDPAALGPQPSHVTVERYVPQTDVLSHCAAVVSHAGSGTFLAALSYGLPQLCLPQAADQFRNSAGAVNSGAGLVLRPHEATPDAVAHAVRRILVEESFRAAARGIANDIRAMPSPPEVVLAMQSR